MELLGPKKQAPPDSASAYFLMNVSGNVTVIRVAEIEFWRV